MLYLLLVLPDTFFMLTTPFLVYHDMLSSWKTTHILTPSNYTARALLNVITWVTSNAQCIPQCLKYRPVIRTALGRKPPTGSSWVWEEGGDLRDIGRGGVRGLTRLGSHPLGRLYTLKFNRETRPFLKIDGRHEYYWHGENISDIGPFLKFDMR